MTRRKTIAACTMRTCLLHRRRLAHLLPRALLFRLPFMAVKREGKQRMNLLPWP